MNAKANMAFKKTLGFLIGARFFRTIVLAFALYVSTFFIFNTKESSVQFILDFKVHGIILSGLMSILSGGMINQFYDQEKDKITQPFRTHLQAFIQQKTFLLGYLLLSIFSLILSAILSERVFVFYFIFQVLIWAYSHKFSRILFINNLLFVGLSLYPFFGMVIYFEAYNTTVFLLALYLFFLLLVMDLLKDITTRKADDIFRYHTLASVYGIRKTRWAIHIILFISLFISGILVKHLGEARLLSGYFWSSYVFFIFLSILLFRIRFSRIILCIQLIKLWIFIGIIWIMLDGIY